MTLKQVAQEYKRLRQVVEDSDEHISPHQREVDRFKGLKRKANEDFQARHPLEELDREITKFLLDHDFQRIESLPFHRDVFRNYSRSLRKNPLFLLDKGDQKYGFRIDSGQTDKRYDFKRFNNTGNLNAILRYLDSNPGDEKASISVFGGAGTGIALPWAVWGGLEGAVFSLIGGIFGTVGGCFLMIPWIILGELADKKYKGKEIAYGNYEVIPKLIETLT
jgi:hypothetical protein